MNESTLGGLFALALAAVAFYMAVAYDPKKNGDVHMGGGSPLGCIFGVILTFVFGDNATRVGFALGGLLCLAIGVAGLMQWL